MCGNEKETWEHVWEDCASWGEGRGWQKMRRVVLGKDGKGEEWLRKLKAEREGNEKQEDEERRGREGMRERER